MKCIIFFVIIFLFILIYNKYNYNIVKGGNNNTNIIIDKFEELCKKNNINYDITNKRMIIFIKKHRLVIKNKKYIHTNPICKNDRCTKPYNSSLFHKNNLPTPKYQVFGKVLSKKNIEEIINDNNINFPSVIKPIDSSLGHKVYINIKNKNELKYILQNNFLNQTIPLSSTQKIMIEEFYTGDNFRIICYKNKILYIIKKIPLHIIGNGNDSLEVLIQNLKQSKKHVDYVFLKNNGIKLNEVVPLNKKVILNPLANGSQGSILENINIKDVHIDNINLFEKINTILKYNLSGIDFIIPDISKSYKTQKSAINEINSSPELKITKNIDNIISTILL
tara:strand:+ start:191 stop:1195 length:1005 start_codon:yes stop_codon:yes gene_type:complete